MKYLLAYTENNGYSCDCCRHEWTVWETFNFREDLEEFLEKIDKADIEVIIEGEDLTEKYKK